MKPFLTTGRVDKGQLKIRNRRELEKWAQLQRDGEYTVMIERQHATRNLEQNALYWAGYVQPLVEYTGYSAKEMHLYLKARFLPAQKRAGKVLLLHNQHGEIVDEYELDLSTTTNLNKVEFSEYLNEIQVFAASLGVSVGSNREDAA